MDGLETSLWQKPHMIYLILSHIVDFLCQFFIFFALGVWSLTLSKSMQKFINFWWRDFEKIQFVYITKRSQFSHIVRMDSIWLVRMFISSNAACSR